MWMFSCPRQVFISYLYNFSLYVYLKFITYDKLDVFKDKYFFGVGHKGQDQCLEASYWLFILGWPRVASYVDCIILNLGGSSVLLDVIHNVNMCLCTLLSCLVYHPLSLLYYCLHVFIWLWYCQLLYNVQCRSTCHNWGAFQIFTS